MTSTYRRLFAPIAPIGPALSPGMDTSRQMATQTQAPAGEGVRRYSGSLHPDLVGKPLGLGQILGHVRGASR